MTITLPLAIKYLTNDAYQREVDGCCDGVHFDECLDVVIEAAKREMERGHIDMTDIEQRKAAAFEWLESLSIKIPYEIGWTLLELTGPSRHRESFWAKYDEITLESLHTMPLDDLRKAAENLYGHLSSAEWHIEILQKRLLIERQPSQEWMDISTAPGDGTELLAIVMGCDSGKLKRIVISYSIDQDCWLFDGSELSYAWDIISWTHLQPLPEPPKDKP